MPVKSVVLSFALSLMLVACGDAADLNEPQRLPHKEIGMGNTKIKVQIADEEHERAIGLMHVREMPEMNGMLFIWPQAEPRSFWMRNTYIPLDLMFIRSGEVIKIISWAKPLDESPLNSGGEADMVLEMNGGWAARHGVQVGDKIRF